MADEDAAETEADDSAEATARLRSKNGVPRASLETIDGQAQKIWAAARRQTVPAVTIARALTGKNDSKASGGAYRARIAALRVFKVVDAVKGGQFKLTDLGVALANVGDADAHASALKAAMQGVSAYAQILERYEEGGIPGPGPIATQFEFEYELSGTDAALAADLFIESAKYAGLMDDDGIVNLEGAPPRRDEDDADEDDEDDLDTDTADDTNTDTDEAEETPADDYTGFTPPPADVTRQQTPLPPAPVVTGVPGVGLNVKLDMSAWPVDDVIRVLAALGFEANNGPE